MKQFSEKLMIFLSCFTVLFIIYSPVVFIPYAFHDDFNFFPMLTRKELNLQYLYDSHYFLVFIGRPLGAWIMTIFNWLITSFLGLAIARFVLILTLSLCSYLYMCFLRKHVYTRLQSFLISIAIFTLPSFEIIVSWVGAGYILYAILLGISSAFILDGIEDGKRDRRSNLKRFNCFCLLFFALLIYPSGAMFYWVIPAHVLFLSMPTGMRYIQNKMRDFFAIGFMAMLLYACKLALMKAYYANRVGSFYNPYVLTAHYFEKLRWFISDPLANSLNLWNIFPTLNRTCIVSFFLFATCVLLAVKIFGQVNDQQKRKQDFFWFVINSGALLCLILLSFLPNLAATSDAGFYRCTSALSAIVIIAFIWSIEQWQALLFKSFNKGIFVALLFVLCLYGGTQANKNIFLYRALPSFVESSYLRSILNTIDTATDTKLVFVIPNSSPVRSRFDEFGVPSTWFHDNVVRSTLGTLVDLQKVKYLNPKPKLRFYFTSDKRVILPDQTIRIIDMQELYEPYGPLNYLKVKKSQVP